MIFGAIILLLLLILVVDFLLGRLFLCKLLKKKGDKSIEGMSFRNFRIRNFGIMELTFISEVRNCRIMELTLLAGLD